VRCSQETKPAAGSKLFPFEPSHSARYGLKSYIRLSECFPEWPLVQVKTLQTLFGTPGDASASSVNAREQRLRIVNCGDFCGDLSNILAHLATSQISSPQLPNRLNLRGLQGFLPSVQQVSNFDGNGLRNQRSGVQISSGAPLLLFWFQLIHADSCLLPEEPKIPNCDENVIAVLRQNSIRGKSRDSLSWQLEEKTWRDPRARRFSPEGTPARGACIDIRKDGGTRTFSRHCVGSD
jgi:hypothetical protein